MFITELSIKRPTVSWVMSLILIIFGLFVFWKLPVINYGDAKIGIVKKQMKIVSKTPEDYENYKFHIKECCYYK